MGREGANKLDPNKGEYKELGNDEYGSVLRCEREKKITKPVNTVPVL